MLRRLILGGITAFAFLASTDAATINVPANQPTIQAAVNAAVAGDTIVVKSNTYFEVVNVPAGKDGLTIKGKGTCILDTRPAGVASGAGFTVASANVTIEGFTIRHAFGNPGNPHGVLSGVGSDGLHLKKLRIEHCNGAGINVAATNVTVEQCVLFGNDGGISITGADATVSKCVVKQDGQDGCNISGNNAVVSKCTFKNIEDGNGVEIDGGNALVEKCVIDSADAPCIDINGTGFAIRNNKIVRQGDDGIGIIVASALAGLIEKNAVANTAQSGIEVSANASSITVRNNKVKDCGTEDEPGILVASTSCVVSKNSVSGGQSDGFRITGASCTISDNSSTGNGEDGFDVEGGACTISGNKAFKNLAEGIENNGLLATLTGNTMKKNRLDLTNDGSFATPPAGNNFSSGGIAVAPQIDD